MYQPTLIQPDGTARPCPPGETMKDAINAIVDTLTDAGIEPRLGRRFAIHLSRQPLGTEVRHQPTGCRFRIDQLDPP